MSMNDATAVALYEAGKEAERMMQVVRTRSIQLTDLCRRTQAVLNLWEPVAQEYEAANEKPSLEYKALLEGVSQVAVALNAIQRGLMAETTAGIATAVQQ